MSTTPVFPLQNRQDSSKFQVSQEDPAVRSEMEGGYTYSRTRFTRKPRKLFNTGFSMLDDAAKLTLEQFYQDMAGGSTSFEWNDPTTATTYTVRFKSPIEFEYVGLEGLHLWDINNIQLEEV